MGEKRRSYSKEFKREAVELSQHPDRQVKQVAEELGINRNLLTRWRSEFRESGELAFPGQGKEALTPEEKEIRRLKKELRIAREERDILKKATAIFSKKQS